ncbi:MAG: MBL fold metallo-hydrolase [Bacillota bacterium]|nr:MBL fold metallo-hydrolase [Bacillota bacterium]
MTEKKNRTNAVINLSVGMIDTNCYIYFNGETKDAIIIDPGDEPEKILGAVREKGLRPGYILLTHGHFDHILAAQDMKEATGAKLAVSPKDADMLRKNGLEEFQAFLKGRFKEAKPDFLLYEGDTITLGPLSLSVIETPGHTEGSCVFRTDGILFTGDTLFYRECGRCDLSGGDYGKMLGSLKKIAGLPGDYTVLPGHGEKTTLGEERLYNPYMKDALARQKELHPDENR